MFEDTTYDADCPNEDFGRRVVAVHHLRDEVGGHADNSNHAYDLKNSNGFECCAEGTVIWSSHCCGDKWICEEKRIFNERQGNGEVRESLSGYSK